VLRDSTFDLTPNGDTRSGALVEQGQRRDVHRDLEPRLHPVQRESRRHLLARSPPSTWTPAWASSASPAIIQGTKEFADFANAKISNYETDIFRPIFDEIEKHSGKKYGSTLPKPGSTGDTEQEKVDVAFRVIADHIRTLSFAIADGIQPGNNDRNYVLRRILRRAVRYGRTPRIPRTVLLQTRRCPRPNDGRRLPEIRTKQQQVKDVLKLEEEAFNKTLDRGIALSPPMPKPPEPPRSSARRTPLNSTTPTASRSTSPS
jgi:alanyl-tRNA synthetase